MNKLYFLAAFSVFALILNVGSAFAYVSLTFSATTVPSTVEPGQQANIILTISNTGTEVANTLNLNLASMQYVSFSNSVFNLGSLNSGTSTTVTIPATVLANAPEGSVSIPISVSYNAASVPGTSTSTNSVIITITKRPLLEVSSVSYDKDVIQVGDTVKMTVSLQNKGSGAIKDLDISIRNFSLPLVPADTDTEKIISSLPPGQTANVTFNLIVNQDAQAIVYSVPLSVSFYDEQGAFHTDTKYAGLKVSGIPDFVISVEKLDSFFQGSSDGKITVSLSNTGSGRAFYLTSYASSDFALIPSVNYIGNTDPDDTNTINLDANLVGVPTGQHNLNVTLVYKNSYNEQFSKTYNLNVGVVNRPAEISSSLMVVIALIVLAVVYWKRHFFGKLIKRK